MIRIAVSLFFALCLTLASSAHLMAEPLGVSGYVPTVTTDITPKQCEDKVQLRQINAIEQPHFCVLAASSNTPKSQHRCQIDISPIVHPAQQVPDGSGATQMDQLRLSPDRYALEPALEPPRHI